MSEPRQVQKLLFLETTIQIDRVIGDQPSRDTIRHNTDGECLCTSGHVLAEYNRTLIRDAITFRNLLRTSPDVEEAVKRFTNSYSRSRKLARTVKLLATLGWDKDKQKTLERLDDFIEWRAHDKFWEGIDRSYCTDEVGCALRLWQAKQTETGQYNVDGLKCLKASPPSCEVGDFIESNRTVLKQFASVACGHSRIGVAKSAQMFDAILEGQDVPFGERNCYLISDTMIVLEAPCEAEVYSTDGDIHAICEILGKLQ